MKCCYVTGNEGGAIVEKYFDHVLVELGKPLEILLCGLPSWSWEMEVAQSEAVEDGKAGEAVEARLLQKSKHPGHGLQHHICVR